MTINRAKTQDIRNSKVFVGFDIPDPTSPFYHTVKSIHVMKEWRNGVRGLGVAAIIVKEPFDGEVPNIDIADIRIIKTNSPKLKIQFVRRDKEPRLNTVVSNDIEIQSNAICKEKWSSFDSTKELCGTIPKDNHYYHMVRFILLMINYNYGLKIWNI